MDSAKNAASPVHVEAYGSVTAPGPVAIARRRTADHRRVRRATNNKDSTHNVQGRAASLTLAEGVQGRAHTPRNTRARNYIRRNPADIFLRKVITRLPRSLGIANYLRMCVARARAATAPAYVMTAITCTASALWKRTAVRNAFDYVTQGRRCTAVAIDVTLQA